MDGDFGIFRHHIFFGICVRIERIEGRCAKEKDKDKESNQENDERYRGFGKIVDSSNVEIDEEEEVESVERPREVEETQ